MRQISQCSQNSDYCNPFVLRKANTPSYLLREERRHSHYNITKDHIQNYCSQMNFQILETNCRIWVSKVRTPVRDKHLSWLAYEHVQQMCDRYPSWGVPLLYFLLVLMFRPTSSLSPDSSEPRRPSVELIDVARGLHLVCCCLKWVSFDPMPMQKKTHTVLAKVLTGYA